MIHFHDSSYCCLKHFYLEKVCKHMRHLFPWVVSYNRFVEQEKELAIPLALFIKKVLLGKCTAISKILFSIYVFNVGTKIRQEERKDK